MAGFMREVRVPCKDSQGRVIAELHLVQADNHNDSIRVLSGEEAREFGEEQIQLFEGRVYDFELKSTGTHRVQSNRVVKTNSIIPKMGRIDTGVETGLLQIVVEDGQNGEHKAQAAVEIVSTKIDYRRDYRGMLSFIANECTELLFDVRASSRMRIAPKFQVNAENLQQQLEFLATELNSRNFVAAVQRVTSMPHQKLKTEWQEQSMSRLRKGGRELARQIASAKSRVIVPAGSSVAQTMRGLGIEAATLPRSIKSRRQVDTLDTPENRFVKHVLTHFLDFLKRIELKLRGSRSDDRERLIRKVRQLQEQLVSALSTDMFKSVSAPNMLPLGSPVLQRKSGYREILLSWLKFDVASELVWKGGADVYGAGKRDNAVLYEYWLFFQLLRLFRDKFQLEIPAAKTLFQTTEGGLNLRLKVNEPLGIQGRCIRDSRRLLVRFHYNLTQERSNGRDQPGSWTQRMRPDYTLSFWPDGFSLEEAETQELAVHIHFDAKYRVDHITELFGNGSEDLGEEKVQQKRGNYKRADLLKMHAYRDAIRRSEGAYILYPGAPLESTQFQGFHEILPGLGAFALKPGEQGEAVGLQQLSRFVDEVVEHVCNRATAREQSSYHQFNVYRANERSGGAKIASAIPERDTSGPGERTLPPGEHSVLVGWCNNEAHFQWIQKTGLYNFRAGSRQGSVRLDPSVVGARHLMLHGKGNQAWPGLLTIGKRGPRIFTAEELLKKGYPSDPDPSAIYAVFDVEPDVFYNGWQWDYKNLAGKKVGPASAEPFAVSLVQLLATHK